jgi:hypothetical protein
LPPRSAFFLTAPLFALLAGMLLLWSGPDLFASRWTPAALALTHLISAGFMLQVMLGAMIQILPVVAGANIAQPLLLATLVHAALTLGRAAAGRGLPDFRASRIPPGGAAAGQRRGTLPWRRWPCLCTGWHRAIPPFAA